MFNVNNHIKKFLLNEYQGSERKATVILDDNKKYMIKEPDLTRELERKEILSYINNVYSEYIGCQIAQNIGFNVQNTKLGEYTTKNKEGKETTKIVCLCEDVRKKNEQMREFDKVALSLDNDKSAVTFKQVEDIIIHIKDTLQLSEEKANEIKDFYYKLFIFDALVGNTDRHNGNVAILLNENNEFSRIAPVYDCGSCLLPLIDDSEIDNFKAIDSIAMSINSVIKDENGNTIRYDDYMVNVRNEAIDKALQEVICNINLSEINKIIDKADFISDKRKQFYQDILQIRYDKILIKALEKTLPKAKEIEIAPDINLYNIYLKYIKPIAELNKFEKQNMIVENNNLEIMKVSNRYALCIGDNKCIGLIPIRSNNDEVREALKVFANLDIDLLKTDNNLKKEHKRKDAYEYEL